MQNKKESKALNCMIKQPLWQVLDAYTEETGIPKTVVVEKALKVYLRGHVDRSLLPKLDEC